jgi:hypothetical protein
MLAIDRCTGTHGTVPLYRQLLSQSGGDASLQQSLFDMIDFPLSAQGSFRTDLTLAWLETAGRAGWEKAGRPFVAANPALEHFTRAQRVELVALWASFGDLAGLRAAIAAHPELERDAWPALADATATRHEYQQACELAFRYLPSPALPKLPVRSVADAERAATAAPEDFVAQYQLSVAQRAAGDWAGAGETLARLAAFPGAPPYIAYQRAEVEAAQQHWEAAWQQLRQYQAGLPRPRS